jgi:hypothetical protein
VNQALNEKKTDPGTLHANIVTFLSNLEKRLKDIGQLLRWNANSSVLNGKRYLAVSRQ